jgi:hypothetical protein
VLERGGARGVSAVTLIPAPGQVALSQRRAFRLRARSAREDRRERA